MSKITFKINGKQCEVDGAYGPDVTLNEYIRNVCELRGTKAMCHEGGCGACLVAVRSPAGTSAAMDVFSVNSCLVSVLSCHGWEITTVEGVGNRTAGYHQIQTRLASFNGTQCGYCTPGWIINMYSLHAKNKKLTMKDIENSFAGNICRCTGYRPIADAFKTFANDVDSRLLEKLADVEDLGMFKSCGIRCQQKCRNKCKDNDEVNDNWHFIEKLENKMIEIDCGNHKWFKAFTMDDIFKVIGRGNEYKLIAGNTGQGVYHISGYPQNVIDIFDVASLKGYSIDVNLSLGAGMPLTEMMEVFQVLSKNPDFSFLQQFYDHMDLVAHIPVRNIGTIGGNLFMKYLNNDFQSDLFLLFETVGGMLTIAENVNKTKVVSFPAFLKMDMKKKVILNVLLPPLSNCCHVKTYKIMPRSQNAHAVVNAGFMFKLKKNSDKIEKATIVYGSISPTFIHASKTETELVGKDLYTNETLQLALKSLVQEVIPEEAPPEPSAAYRKMLALALFYKALLSLAPDNKIDKRFRSGGSVIKRATSQGTQIFDTDKSIWPLNQPIPKIEALVQCSGEATFANDLPKHGEEVFASFVLGYAVAGSVIGEFDASEALKIPGVIAFYTAKDIPGDNTFTPLNVPLTVNAEEILCSKEIKFYGQPVGIIVADREKTANKAAELVKVKFSTVYKNKPLLTIQDVLNSPQKNKRSNNELVIEPKDKGSNVNCVIHGELSLESQYHYTLETQTTVVKPTEDGMEVYSSTQALDSTNVAVGQCLKIPMNRVNVIVRRVGGGYGGKITRSTQIACAAALVSHLQGKVCRMILPLETNMRAIGKRVPTYCKFEVGVSKDGEIQYLNNKYYQDNGCSPNETLGAITISHFRNCYDATRWLIDANSVATDNASNTWCRAPASTEGVAMIEFIMERIAYNLNKDPIEVRLKNMAKGPVPDLIDQIKKDSNYDQRMKDIVAFNANNRWKKRAIKLIPMTYEIFYFGPFNALISIYYADGSVMITHGGIEMGQGINTKVAQVCAYKFGIPLEKVSVKPSSTFTSPNCMPTGGSIGSECISLAVVKACDIILRRLEPFKKDMKDGSWEELVKAAYNGGVELQASHQFTVNDGLKPYDIYGVVVLEVEVDILTGNHDIIRVDILEDTGRSLSPTIDVAQIEGAFVMGLGYWTSEKLVFDPATGKLLTDRTWTYKPPGIKDIPADFRVYFRRNSNNPVGVLQSKATGEPAFCLAVVITHAIREAVREARKDAGLPDQWVDIPKETKHLIEHEFFKDGEIQYLNNKYYQDNGCSPNETLGAITISHFRNCYDATRWLIDANSVATDNASNTWCRAPASTEGVAMIEFIMERIAYNLNKDPIEVRLKNMAKGPVPDLIDQIKKDSNYDQRMKDIVAFNANNRWKKRAIKLIPMTYEIFYFGPFNALISIYYADGSVMITHGGIEMGQGINTKVAQVCAYKFGIPLEKVSVKPSSTFTSPNCMPTGGSIGSECISLAVVKACDIILRRLEPFKKDMKDGSWEELVKAAYNGGVELQASHQFTVNDGLKPYDIYGVVVLEVEVDILTGNHDIIRVDILEDTGRSLSPTIDVAQIEGAFVMGLGYWTSEKLVFDPATGKLLTDRTWTYKPPGIKDIPADFRVYFRRNSNNPVGVLQSKATGEPAFCLAVVITHAIREAVREARKDAGLPDQWVDIQNPFTVENIFMGVGHKIEHFKLTTK